MVHSITPFGRSRHFGGSGMDVLSPLLTREQPSVAASTTVMPRRHSPCRAMARACEPLKILSCVMEGEVKRLEEAVEVGVRLSGLNPPSDPVIAYLSGMSVSMS